MRVISVRSCVLGFVESSDARESLMNGLGPGTTALKIALRQRLDYQVKYLNEIG